MLIKKKKLNFSSLRSRHLANRYKLRIKKKRTLKEDFF